MYTSSWGILPRRHHHTGECARCSCSQIHKRTVNSFILFQCVAIAIVALHFFNWNNCQTDVAFTVISITESITHSLYGNSGFVVWISFICGSLNYTYAHNHMIPMTPFAIFWYFKRNKYINALCIEHSMCIQIHTANSVSTNWLCSCMNIEQLEFNRALPMRVNYLYREFGSTWTWTRVTRINKLDSLLYVRSPKRVAT